MFFKVLALVAIVAVAHAGPLMVGGYGGHHDSGTLDAHEGLQYEHHQEDHHVDYYHHPKYEYKYSIEDPHTGDYKTQSEHRDGDKVEGEYSFLDSDGKFRKVQYTADKHSGFQAIVTKDGDILHPQPQPQAHHY